MEELSCVDLIMSWMESDPVKLIEFHVTSKGPEHAFKYLINKENGSKYESFDADREQSLTVPANSKLDQGIDSAFDVFCKSKNVVFEPDRLLRHQYPAPPPKLHYSTQWRKLTKKLYLHSSNAMNRELN